MTGIVPHTSITRRGVATRQLLACTKLPFSHIQRRQKRVRRCVYIIREGGLSFCLVAFRTFVSTTPPSCGKGNTTIRI